MIHVDEHGDAFELFFNVESMRFEMAQLMPLTRSQCDERIKAGDEVLKALENYNVARS